MFPKQRKACQEQEKKNENLWIQSGDLEHRVQGEEVKGTR